MRTSLLPAVVSRIRWTSRFAGTCVPCDQVASACNACGRRRERDAACAAAFRSKVPVFLDANIFWSDFELTGPASALVQHSAGIFTKQYATSVGLGLIGMSPAAIALAWTPTLSFCKAPNSRFSS